MTIVQVRSGKPVPIEAIEKAPDCSEKEKIKETHGICFECAKRHFPSLDHKVLFENIAD